MKPILLSLSACMSLAVTSCTSQKTPSPDNSIKLVKQQLMPIPDYVTTKNGSVVLSNDTSVALGKGTNVVGLHFIKRLQRGTGWSVPQKAEGTIKLKLVEKKSDSPEAYELVVSGEGITIQASKSLGIARGVETLMQLMPTKIYGKNKIDKITLPFVTIKDSPQFRWRALSLDVSRRFQNKDAVLKLLDGMAVCKLNTFHWHLTDDQGWRLPIKGYPKLTSNPKVSYTREDIAEVVKRAEELGITIMPEIDMPGHSRAACRAYPEIGSLGGAPMNPGSEATYKFIDAVIADVALQFPNSPYIHIGADEVGTGRWRRIPECVAIMKKEKMRNTHALYTYFVNKVIAIVKKHGRKPASWDEALSSHVDPSLTILSWRGMYPGIKAAKMDHPVVFCPTPQIYFDHPNTRSKKNPYAYSANASYLNHCYFFNPGLAAVPKEKRHLILGGEACLWSERIKSAHHMFIMMFPRAWAIGETLWSKPQYKNWNDFVKRLDLQKERFDAMKIPCFWEPKSLAETIGKWDKGELNKKKGVIDIPLKGKLRTAGLQEFFIAQGEGEGHFIIEGMELIKNGAVISHDWHRYESSIYKDAKSLFLLRTSKLDGEYVLRVHANQAWGDCSSIVQIIHALPEKEYSRQCGSFSGSNRTRQTNRIRGDGFLPQYLSLPIRKPEVKVSTLIKAYPGNSVKDAGDWNRITYFRSANAPKKGDTFTWNFNKPLPSSDIEIRTGLPTKNNSITSAKLQVSIDGKTFSSIADFSNGMVKAASKQAVTAVRILIIADHKNAITINDPYILTSLQQVPVRVKSNIPCRNGSSAQLTVDGNKKTYLHSNRPPKAGDQITWSFKNPIPVGATVKIKTGDPHRSRRDYLRHGLLEFSTDDLYFKSMGGFRGTRVIKVEKEIKALRLKVTRGERRGALKIQDLEIRY